MRIRWSEEAADKVIDALRVSRSTRATALELELTRCIDAFAELTNRTGPATTAARRCARVYRPLNETAASDRSFPGA